MQFAKVVYHFAVPSRSSGEARPGSQEDDKKTTCESIFPTYRLTAPSRSFGGARPAIFQTETLPFSLLV
jgi:hypothetical protein